MGIVEHPADYYDTSAFPLPVPLNAPELLDSLSTLSLASYLRKLDPAKPFQFYSKEVILDKINARNRTIEVERSTGEDEVSNFIYPGRGELMLNVGCDIHGY
jgi:hypothetical protein